MSRPARTTPPFAVTVDLVVLTIRDGALAVLLVTARRGPGAGRRGRSRRLRAARRGPSVSGRARELAEETGLGLSAVHLEQLASYGDPGRDPRMRVVTVAYLALAPELPAPRPAGGDAAGSADCGAGARSGPRAGVRPWPDPRGRPRTRPREARVHAAGRRVLPAGVHGRPAARRLRGRVGHHARPAELPPQGHRHPGLRHPGGRGGGRERGRPAQLYRKGSAATLYPPLLRP